MIAVNRLIGFRAAGMMNGVAVLRNEISCTGDRNYARDVSSVRGMQIGRSLLVIKDIGVLNFGALQRCLIIVVYQIE